MIGPRLLVRCAVVVLLLRGLAAGAANPPERALNAVVQPGSPPPSGSDPVDNSDLDDDDDVDVLPPAGFSLAHPALTQTRPLDRTALRDTQWAPDELLDPPRPLSA